MRQHSRMTKLKNKLCLYYYYAWTVLIKICTTNKSNFIKRISMRCNISINRIILAKEKKTGQRKHKRIISNIHLLKRYSNNMGAFVKNRPIWFNGNFSDIMSISITKKCSTSIHQICYTWKTYSYSL